MDVTLKNITVPDGGYIDVRIFADGYCVTACKAHPYYAELETEIHDERGEDD